MALIKGCWHPGQLAWLKRVGWVVPVNWQLSRSLASMLSSKLESKWSRIYGLPFLSRILKTPNFQDFWVDDIFGDSVSMVRSTISTVGWKLKSDAFPPTSWAERPTVQLVLLQSGVPPSNDQSIYKVLSISDTISVLWVAAISYAESLYKA